MPRGGLEAICLALEPYIAVNKNLQINGMLNLQRNQRDDVLYTLYLEELSY
jgi:hypothetical protein